MFFLDHFHNSYNFNARDLYPDRITRPDVYGEHLRLTRKDRKSKRRRKRK